MGMAQSGRCTRSALNIAGLNGTIRHKSESADGRDAASVLKFSSITDSIGRNNKDISNVISPISGLGSEQNKDDGSKTARKAHEVPVKYVLNCIFGKNNSHFTYSAVVEDVNYLRNNPGLSYNEAFLYYLKLPQRVKFSVSTGYLGFRKAARGEYEASFQTAAKVFQMIHEKKLLNKEIEIVMKDFGKGRAAFVAALNGKEGNFIRKHIIRISDKTALKFGGVRSPRTRRL